jgi:hypothetical protein
MQAVTTIGLDIVVAMPAQGKWRMLDASSSPSASPSTANMLRARIEAAIKGQGLGHRHEAIVNRLA